MSGHIFRASIKTSVFVIQGFEAVNFLEKISYFTCGKGGISIPVGNNNPRWQGLQGQTSQILDIHDSWAKPRILFITLSSCNLSKRLKRETKRISIDWFNRFERAPWPGQP